MKIKGKKFDIPNREEIIIPRGSNEPIVFIAEAVLDFDEFEKLCPMPTPPVIVKPDRSKSKDVRDPDFVKKIEKHSRQRMAWMVLKSLQATPELEWETVNMADPETWENYRKELKDSMFTEIEQNMIVFGVLAANSLDEDKIEAARQSFLAGREEAVKIS